MNKRLLLTIAFLLGLYPMGATAEPNKSDTPEDVSAFEKMFGSGPQEEDVYRADRLLVSATGSLKPVRLAPSVASVITATDIEEMGASTLDDVLQTVPGLHAAPSGFNILSSNWSIRGIRTNTNPQVLLLINGVPLTQVPDGQRILTYKMPVAMISRVEVVRGPGSAVHGADAFAGTVNVITKDGHEIDGTKAGVRYGSFDTSDFWLQHGGQYGTWDIVAGIESRKSQGDDNQIIDQDRLGRGTPSLAPGPLDTRSHQVDAHLGFNKGDNWIAKFYGTWINDNAMGAGGAQTLNNNSFVNDTQLLADISYHNNTLLSDWSLSLKTSYLYTDIANSFQFYPANISDLFGEPHATTQTSAIEAIGIYDGFNHHRLRLASGLKFSGTETDEYKNFPPFPAPGMPFGPIRNFKNSPFIYMTDQNRSLWHASVQDEWSMATGWELTVGVRYDEYSDFGSTTNPRVALVWETTPTLTSKLIYGRAFRAPAYSEMYINFNPSMKGNPDLVPETIDTYELAFVWQPTSRLSFTPSAFYYQIDGLIELGGTPQVYDNRRNQKGLGFEIEAHWRATDTLELSGNLANQRSEDSDTGAQTADTPEWQAYLTGNWKFRPNWSLNSQFYWIAERHRAVGDTRPDIADYELVNLTLRRKSIAQHWEAAISIHNAFDEDIREPSPYDATAPSGAFIPNDFPLVSRSLWAELNFHY